MINLSLSMLPFLTGAIHVMANPLNQTSTIKIVENGKRQQSPRQILAYAYSDG